MKGIVVMLAAMAVVGSLAVTAVSQVAVARMSANASWMATAGAVTRSVGCEDRHCGQGRGKCPDPPHPGCSCCHGFPRPELMPTLAVVQRLKTAGPPSADGTVSQRGFGSRQCGGT